MDWLIVGLGNPGERYRNTRHNAGFQVVDSLAKKMAISWKMNNRFKAEVGDNGRVCLTKPQTFMNLSGDAVGSLLRFYKLPPDKLIVIHDDLDLALGTIKYGLGKGPKVHNGLQSVESMLGTPAFWRVRVGIENRTGEERQMFPGERYVLMSLTQAEQTNITQGIEQAISTTMDIIHNRVVANGNEPLRTIE